MGVAQLVVRLPPHTPGRCPRTCMGLGFSNGGRDTCLLRSSNETLDMNEIGLDAAHADKPELPQGIRGKPNETVGLDVVDKLEVSLGNKQRMAPGPPGRTTCPHLLYQILKLGQPRFSLLSGGAQGVKL